MTAGGGELIFDLAGVAARPRLPEPLPPGEWISYTLFITLMDSVEVDIGRLGRFSFPAGEYAYTGSARRHLSARVNRHLSPAKKLRWHIDYLLTAPEAEIHHVALSTRPECELLRLWGGEIVVRGFGASDCRAGCGSHLRRLE